MNTEEKYQRWLEQMRVANKKYRERNKGHLNFLRREYYKKMIIDENYKTHIYEQNKQNRDKLKQKQIEAGEIIPKQRGRPRKNII